MSIKGYVDYKRREFCKDVKCPVQSDLDAQKEGSFEYEKIRQTCKTNCRYTTYQFHHWLIEKGYLIVRPEK
jgi:phage antirepressor YoqD-like protein